LGNKTYSIKAKLKYAGAFIAWVIGSGFATGQEIFQFFSSYGYVSYGAVLINLLGFIFIGSILMLAGYDHKTTRKFNHFKYYCGNKLGIVYTWLVPITLILTMTVLIAASGSALYEYYNVNRYIGSGIMAAMVLIAYLIGFENMVKIVSKIGPVLIIFVLIVGSITLLNDFSNIGNIGDYSELLAISQPAPNWLLSAILYLSLNFLAGSTYYTALGRSAQNRSDAKWGAIIGAVALISVIVIMNTSYLLNAATAAHLSVPTLYLSMRISYVLGTIFTVVLMLGMFSSCSAMMWSFCNQLFADNKTKNRIVAIAVAVFTFAIGLFFTFRDLVSIFYPFIGYVGLIFIGCVVYKGVRRIFKKGHWEISPPMPQ